MIPTIEQVIKCYRMIALTERMKTGRPGEETVANAVRGLKQVCTAAGIQPTAPVTELTRQRFDSALATFTGKGLTRLSAWSYICQMRAVFARWCLPYYSDAGWEIPRMEMPSFRAKAPRYQRPCAETLARVKAWYRTLEGEYWFAATMMLEFAMRNGDVLRLTKDNFVERRIEGDVFNRRSLRDTQNCARPDLSSPVSLTRAATNLIGRGSCQNESQADRDQAAFVAEPQARGENAPESAARREGAKRGEAGRKDPHKSDRSQSACAEGTCGSSFVMHYLSYTPHKTELSSGRRVFWPIHPDIWAKYEEYGGIDCLDVTDEIFVDINRQLRSIGFRGHKGAYELRKICIDHIYQKFGAEMAVSLSGDDIKTISRYYADPAQPNFGVMRIIDML